jgi:hypothetical protein
VNVPRLQQSCFPNYRRHLRSSDQAPTIEQYRSRFPISVNASTVSIRRNRAIFAGNGTHRALQLVTARIDRSNRDTESGYDCSCYRRTSRRMLNGGEGAGASAPSMDAA